ncbi:MAG: hypothetical protein ACFFCI_21455 [Promethearchaeota archaeon]
MLTLATLGLLIFSFFQVAYAEPGKWPAYLFKKEGYLPNTGGQHIGAWYYPFIGPEGHWEVSAGEYCFFRTGWMVSDYEIETGLDPGPPYQYRLFIDDEEITMQRWTWTIPKDTLLFPDGVYRDVKIRAWMWVVRFEPGYFEAGKSYMIRVQFLVQKPYFGSDIVGWRFYVNHMTGGGIPPADFTWEDWYGTAGVVNDQFHWLDVV